MRTFMKTIKGTVLTCVLTVFFAVPTFAGVSATNNGPVFVVAKSDTVMNASISANQQMTIKNKVGGDLEIFLDNTYQGYIPNGNSGSFTSVNAMNLTATHQVVNGMHVLKIVSVPLQSVENKDKKAEQIAAIDAQIAQISAYYQQAQSAGDVELMNTSLNLIEVLKAQKAALQK